MLLEGWCWCCQCPAATATFQDTEVKPAFAEHPELAEQASRQEVVLPDTAFQ